MFESLSEGIALRKFGAPLNNLFFIWRRIIFIVLAMFYSNRPVAQILIYLLLSYARCIFIVGVWPFEMARANWSELFNEYIITIVGVHQIVLMAFVTDS